ANRNTQANKNGKPNISKKVTRSAAHRRKKRSGAPGPRSTNRAGAAKRAEVAAVKKKVKPAHAKAGEREAGKRSAEPSLWASRKTGSHGSLTGTMLPVLIFDT